jgi:DNA repair exonuclease SbcCD ATPase subunit
MPGFGELAKLGADIAAKQAKKSTLEMQLKGELSEEERGAVEQHLKDVTAEIDAMPNRADVQSIRDRAGRTYDDLAAAQGEFLKVWQDLTGGSGKSGDIDAKKVVERLAALRAKATTELSPIDARIAELTQQLDAMKKQADELKVKGKEADPATVADVKTRLTKAQTDLDPLRVDKKRLDDQIKRLAELEKRFLPGSDGKKLLRELETTVVAGGGFTNMPKWMVQAFAENGFTWGGGWHAPEDAMHYSSMTPIAGLIQPGMG